MSIEDEIKARVVEGRLCPIQPKLPSDPILRPMYVTPELNALVNGPWADAKQEARFSALRADLDFFVAGGLVNKGYMKPLRKRADEVWEIRSRAPSPSIRLFGRFAMPNVFHWDKLGISIISRAI